jgi:hypothetical protein
MGWLGVPGLALLLVTLQGLGFLLVMMDPVWQFRLALDPQSVAHGEYWRLITFLALPLSTSPIWVIFTLWFLYFIVNTIEAEWGEFRTTFYVLISVLLMIGFSFAFDYPIMQIAGFESTLFLAAAALFPETEILLFFFPVKMKWMAAFTGAMVIWHVATGSWLDRLYLLALYGNYVLFFGPAYLSRVKQAYRRWDYKNKSRLP